jgi:tripartite ATP-independent transporter DctP family solute receptor
MMTLTRRAFVGGTLGSAALAVRAIRAAEFTFTQYHNQTNDSPLHRHLAAMWEAIRIETSGRVDTRVYALNNNVPGSDPAALRMLVAGEIQFFTLMGGALGAVVPVTEIEQVPFAFRSPAHAHQVMDGPLGAYLRQEMGAKGIHGFPIRAFENGMRVMTLTNRPVAVPEDLIGIRMRVPPAQIINDTLRAFGAEPVTITIDGVYDALKSGRVHAQENPLAIVDLFKLYEVVKYISMTNHIWSGFNLLANLGAWKSLPGDVKTVIERNVTKHVRLQRQEQMVLNTRLRMELARRGPAVNDVDPAPFRRKLSAVYLKWKKQLGTKCWSLLEAETGALG